ncbi:MAG TPA: response regulator [Acidobacteriota bacterium]|nr:response regulator [Acidobacteriota bacterium]
MNKRILFVDDEPKVLEGIGRMLRSIRFECDMSFAGSGREAQEILSREAFDLVVSDMRMPEMNGLQLLTEIKTRHPNVIRIILSGDADTQMIMYSVGLAHQYLSKPCEADLLRSTILRSLDLRTLLTNDSIKQVVSRLSVLPSLPSLYLEIVQQLQSTDPSIQRVGEIIAKDPAMTAKILQVVNSAFFGIRRVVSSPKDAAAYLGLDTIQSLVLSLHTFSQFDACRFPGFSIGQIWSHSMVSGHLSKKIMQIENQDKKRASEAFTAGLLHDLGKLLLAANLPEEYAGVLHQAAESGEPLPNAEFKAFGSTHAEIGAYLLGLWGLPNSIVEAVALHHRPEDSADRAFGPLSAVYAANLIEHEQAGANGPLLEEDSPYLAAIGKADRLAEWRQLGEEK